MTTSRAMIDLYGKIDCFVDGRDNDSISVASHAAETRAAPGSNAPMLSHPGAATAFDLDACFTMAPPLVLDDGARA